jgi:hypothetical protein
MTYVYRGIRRIWVKEFEEMPDGSIRFIEPEPLTLQKRAVRGSTIIDRNKAATARRRRWVS